jgi:PfaD family protein
MGQAGMLGFFGAGGLGLERVEAAIQQVQAALGDRPYGFNLLHAPNEPDHEAATVELYLKHGVKLVEAAAYLDLTLPLVRYRTAGIHRGPDGKAVAPNRVIAKVSRVEVAEKFMSPAPETMLRELAASGKLTPEQAERASKEPVAQDVTCEADSGGHTDNRPLVTLLPTMIALANRVQSRHRYARPLRLGAAGGIATPSSAAAAFMMGAAYVVTGSVNQACVESGSSDIVRAMLAEAGQADTAMAPAADMFEMGVKVQILKRGTMFAMRAQKLYDLYKAHDSLEALPAAQKAALERDLFRAPLEEIWAQTAKFFEARDPRQLAKANADPKHKMALTFRWYLGQASRWANAGVADRKVDYQVWCGPAMGAFNEWAKGSVLERPENRRAAVVARNLLAGAAVLTEAHYRRLRGEAAPSDFRPLPDDQLTPYFED